MKKLHSLMIALAATMIFTGMFVGCSAEEKTDVSSGFVVEIIDSVAAAVAQNIADTQLSPLESANAVELAERTDQRATGLPPVNDIFVKGSLAYSGFDGGLLIYDVTTDEFSVSPVGENVRAVAEHGDAVFIGGDELYEVDGAALTPVAETIPGQITALCSHGPSLMIGSTEGLFARNILGLITVLEDIEISALVEDEGGLWIGTVGDGLYYYDGFDFRRRHLKRDTALFNEVTALAYNHDHLYLGTPGGMFVYDGGRWETVSTENGLPTNEVTSIDATGWVVYVGTTAGVSSYFNGEVNPVDRMSNQVITAVARAGSRIIAGTEANGIILKVGPSIKTLVEPWQTGQELASMIH